MKRINDQLERMCITCEHSVSLVDESIVLCKRRGIVPAGNICKRFVYDPLKRIPPRRTAAPKLDYIDIDSEDNADDKNDAADIPVGSEEKK